MRVIAIMHWHDLVPIVIGLALLGFGLAGVFASVRSDRLLARPDLAIGGAAAGFGLTAPGAVIAAARVPLDLPALAWRPIEAAHLAVYAALLLVPLFLSALAITLTFARAPQSSGRFYAANLFGSAAGAALALPVLSLWGPGRSVLLFGGLGAVAAWPALRRVPRMFALAVPVFLFICWTRDLPRIEPCPAKALNVQLLARGSRIVWEKDSFRSRVTLLEGNTLHDAPGLSLQATAEPPRQAALLVDGDVGSPVFPASLEAWPDSLTALTQVLGAAPYRVLTEPEVLVLDGRAGWNAWVARANGARRVDIVEPDATIARALLGMHGNPAFLPSRARVIERDPRSWLALGASRERYDVIVLDIGLPSVGVAAERIDYLLTREALALALERLRPGGLLAVAASLEPFPHACLRVVATASSLFRDEGEDPRRHIVVLRDWASTLSLISRVAWTEGSLSELRRFSETLAFDIAAAPDLDEASSNRFHVLDRSTLYSGLAALTGDAPERFLRSYALDVAPATDDAPFFHRGVRLDRWSALRAELGRDWPRFVGWGYLLSWVGLAAVVVVAAVSLGSVLLAAKRSLVRASFGVALYFGSLGIGFMFLEIAFLGIAELLFGAPTSTMALVTGCLLCGAGLGSWILGNREEGNVLPYALLAGFLGSGAVFALEWLGSRFAGGTGPSAMALLCIGVSGFFMGVPFPRELARLPKTGVPWAFAVSGFFSVLGSLVAPIVAMHLGFRSLAVIAVLAYAVAGLAGGLHGRVARSYNFSG